MGLSRVPGGPFDVAIVGGGPAGLATALHARSAGLSVVVLDRGGPPGDPSSHDKACGEGLMPRAVLGLGRLGVTLGAEDGRAFRGIRFVECEGRTRPPVEARFPRGHGVGVRRIVLHGRLAAQAEARGATIAWGTRVEALLPHGDEALVLETSGGACIASRVVGADGLHSRVRAWAGLDRPIGAERRFGVRRHFALEPWTDCVEVHFARDAQAFVTPLGERLVSVNVTFEREPAAAGLDELLVGFPSLADRLRGAEVASSDRGAGPMRRRVRATHRGRVALVGDASGYVDSIAGEGIGLAFEHADALVAAIVRGDLARYGAAHRRIGLFPGLVTRGLLALARHGSARRALMAALEARPRASSALLRFAATARA